MFTELQRHPSRLSEIGIGLCLGVCMLLGCDSGFTKVTGIVTLDGKPIEGADLYFAMETNPSIYAIGKTDQNGKYSVSTFRGGDRAITGAIPGEYLVTIVKKEEDGPPEKDVSEMTIEEQTNYRMSRAASNGKMRDKKFIYHLPKKYELASTSELKADVPPSGSVVCDFPLTSKK